MKINELLIKAMQVNLIGFIDASIDPEIRAAKSFAQEHKNQNLTQQDIDAFKADIEKLKNHIVDFECRENGGKHDDKT